MKDRFEFRYAKDERRTHVCYTTHWPNCGCEVVFWFYINATDMGECRQDKPWDGRDRIAWDGKKLAKLYNMAKQKARDFMGRHMLRHKCPICGE